MSAVNGWCLLLRLGAILVLAQALLFGIGIGHRGLADIVELLAPGRVVAWMRMLEIIFDHTDEFGRSAVSLEIRRDQLQVGHFRTNFDLRYKYNVRML